MNKESIDFDLSDSDSDSSDDYSSSSSSESESSDEDEKMEEKKNTQPGDFDLDLYKRLKKAKEHLSLGYDKELFKIKKNFFSGERERTYKTIFSEVYFSIKHKKKKFFYFHGSPGTGKTFMTKMLVHELKRILIDVSRELIDRNDLKKKKEYRSRKKRFRHIFVNNFDIENKQNLYELLYSKIFKPNKVSKKQMQKDFLDYLETTDHHLIFVIDEFDELAKKIIRDNDSILQNFQRRCDKIIFIGIGNKALSEIENCDSYLPPVTDFLFKEYKKEELISIANQRLAELKVINTSAITFLVQNVITKDFGNIRTVLAELSGLMEGKIYELRKQKYEIKKKRIKLIQKTTNFQFSIREVLNRFKEKELFYEDLSGDALLFLYAILDTYKNFGQKETEISAYYPYKKLTKKFARRSFDLDQIISELKLVNIHKIEKNQCFPYLDIKGITNETIFANLNTFFEYHQELKKIHFGVVE